MFFIFSPNEAEDFSFLLLKHAHSTAVQPHCIYLQNFAIREIADRPQSPRPAWAAGSFAQHLTLHKKRTQTRWREGDKCFFVAFFMGGRLLPLAKSLRVYGVY